MVGTLVAALLFSGRRATRFVPKIRERADGYYLGQAAAGLPPHRAVKAAEAPLL